MTGIEEAILLRGLDWVFSQPKKNLENQEEIQQPEPEYTPNTAEAVRNLQDEVYTLSTQEQQHFEGIKGAFQALQGGQSVIVWILLLMVVFMAIHSLVLHMRLSNMSRRMENWMLDSIRHHRD
ncbi:MAG: hypothetical protein QE263_04685 [Vampirovibrionales bacterium]|nr:hypothetical protein [Vampirovibrionales bacterium]